MMRTDLPYTSLFCEENIWLLAKRMLDAGSPPDSLWVLFFSNRDRQVVLLNQRRAGEAGYVVWDYHVVLQAGDRIYDFDTTLAFPVDAADYFLDSFPDQTTLAERYRAQLRRIPAASFVERFYSDRNHMHGVIEATAFPAWPAIMPAHDHTLALSDYWDMDKALDDGSEVMGVMAYLHLLGWRGTGG